MESIMSHTCEQFRTNAEGRCTTQTRSSTVTDWNDGSSDDDLDSDVSDCDEDYDGNWPRVMSTGEKTKEAEETPKKTRYTLLDMESIMSHTDVQFRNNAEDRCTAQPRVMSTGEKTKEAGEAKTIFARYLERERQILELERKILDMESIMSHTDVQFRNNAEDGCTAQTRPATVTDWNDDYDSSDDDFDGDVSDCDDDDDGDWPRVMSTGEKTKEAEEAKKMTLGFRLLNGMQFSVFGREGKVVQSAADKIKVQTQELQPTDSDTQIGQTADFVQKISGAILEQKDRLSDKKTPVKETCREVKIFLQQIIDLVRDKWQSLSEEAKLKLESVIKEFWKMTASMWKLIFCVLLLSELRDMLDIVKSESYNISLNGGRLKYAFKMASMLALWLSHDVETNPGPQFNERTCLEMYVRQLSQAFRNDLDTAGSIWSKKTANAAYNDGYPRNLRWNNPSSGKNKDSLPKLKERAKELIRLLSDRSCLPSDLPAFTDLDQKETLDRLKKYLEVKHFMTAANVLLNEPGFTPSLKKKIRHLIQLAQEEISNSEQMIHNPHARPRSVSDINEFQQLADPQCLNDSEGDGTTVRRKQASTDCPGGLSPLTTSMDTQRHEGDNRSPTNRLYTHSVVTDTLQDDASRVAGTTRSDFVCRTSGDNQENIITPCTSETEEQRDVNIVSSSDSHSFDRADGDEASHDILGHINPNTDAPDDIVIAQLESGLYDVMQGDDTFIDTCDMTVDVSLPTDTSNEALLADIENGPSRVFNVGGVHTSLTDTCDMTVDVSLPTNTSDEDILPDIESGPSRVLNSNEVNTSHRYTPNADYSPSEETRNDVPAADGGCEDDARNASEPLHNVSSDKNQVDTVCEGVYETPEQACNIHDCEETSGTEASEATAETDTQTSETTTETDTQACVTAAETDKQACVTTVETDTQECVTTRQTDTQDCVTTRETDTQACVTTRETDTQACVTTRETETQACVTTRETDIQACVTTRETNIQACVTTTETVTQTCVTMTEAETQTCVTTAEIGTQTYLETTETNTQTHVTTTEGDTQTYIASADTDTQTCATTAGTGQTPKSLGNSINQVDSDESVMSPGRSFGTCNKRKRQLQHLPSKKRRI